MEHLELIEFPLDERDKLRITQHLIEYLEDAHRLAYRRGDTELCLSLRRAAIAIEGWERQVREVAWIVNHWPVAAEPWPAPTPWFARTRREHRQRMDEVEDEIAAYEAGQQAAQ